MNSLSNILPEVQIINRALLITHVNVEGKEIDWRKGIATENLKEGWQALTLLEFWNRP